MGKLTFEMRWTTHYGSPRQKFFGTLREMRTFERINLSESGVETSYWLWDGTKREQIVVFEGKMLTKSQVMSLVAKF